MVSIPQDVFDTYKEFGDAMINDLGVNCRLIYPAYLDDCPNCIYDPIGQKSSGRYKTGGPSFFSFGQCPLCKGEGYKEVEDYDTVKLRFYQLSTEYGIPKSFSVIAKNIKAAGGDAFVIGFIYDLPKFEQANNILVNSDLQNYKEWLYERASEAMFHGLGKNEYFIGGLKRVNG